MGHVGFAGIAGLALVIFAGEAEGFFERGEIVLGAVLADLGFQFGVQLLDPIGGEIARQPDGHPAIAGFHPPSGDDLRAGKRFGIDAAIPGAQIQRIQAAAHAHVAVAGSGFERSAQRLRLDAAVAGAQAGFALETGHADVAVAGAYVRLDLARRLHIHLDGVHPHVEEAKAPVGAAHRDLHSVAGLGLPHFHFARADLPAGGGDTDHNLLFVPGVYGDIAVVGLDAQRGLVRNHEGLGPIVGKRASGRESGDDGGLNWQAHERNTPLPASTHKEARMFDDIQRRAGPPLASSGTLVPTPPAAIVLRF
jgi:hypothetical protein